MLWMREKAAALLPLLLFLVSCTTPPQPSVGAKFGPASRTALIIMSDRRAVGIQRVDLQRGVVAKERYFIESKLIEGANYRIDIREIEPGDYAIVFAQEYTHPIGSVYGAWDVTCFARAAPVYHVAAGQITMLPTPLTRYSPAAAVKAFEEVRARYRGITAESRVAKREAVVRLAENVGFWSGCPAGPALSIIE